jgi:hypothetical protein
MAAAPADHTASISSQTIAVLEQATHSRGWIVQSFSQVEFMLGDFIRKCRKIEGYERFADKPPRPFGGRVRRVREIATEAGALSPYGSGLLSIVDAIEPHEEDRHFLAHGWLEVFQGPAGVTLRFRRFSPAPPYNQVFRSFDLTGISELQEQVTSCSRLAMSVFRILYEDFELEMPDAD